jgi:large exoprotein involved in heme utilization and adhesion
VNLTNPNIPPESGLVELPAEVTDSSQQIAQTCASTQTSRFVVTGRGGIPQDPNQTLESDRLWSDVRELSAFSQASSSTAPPVSEALAEATTWRHNAMGQLELVATAAPQVAPTETCAGIN